MKELNDLTMEIMIEFTDQKIIEDDAYENFKFYWNEMLPQSRRIILDQVERILNENN